MMFMNEELYICSVTEYLFCFHFILFSSSALFSFFHLWYDANIFETEGVYSRWLFSSLTYVVFTLIKDSYRSLFI